MKDDCFLIFTKGDKEISIGLNDYGKFIVTKEGYHHDRTNITKGTNVYINKQKYKFIGYICNEILTNTIPDKYKRIRPVMQTIPSYNNLYPHNVRLSKVLSPPKINSLKKSPMKTKSYNKSPIKPRTPPIKKNMTEKFNTLENALNLLKKNWNNATKKIKK